MDREEEMSVMRSKGELVRPFGATPSGVVDLSVIDMLPVLRCNTRTLHVFRGGPSVVDSDAQATMVVLRQALSKALVPYYPLAGRLQHSAATGELEVSCTGEGVWFVEASANCTLDSVSYFEDVASIPFDKLLPLLEGEGESSIEGADPLVLMQVTKFECGGYVMGLIFCHSICDGLGAAQFLNAVGEFARGLHQLTVAPLWHRHFLPHHHQRYSPTPNELASFSLVQPPMPSYQLEQTNIDIPIHHINILKQKFHHSTGGQTSCSSFEIVAASLWSRRTRAINLSKDTQVKLVFFANCRHLLEPPLPKGFYGNCFFPVTITASSEKVAHSSIGEVVKLIQEAKTRLPIEFHKWITKTTINNEEEEEEDPFAPPLVYTTLFISEWGRLGFNEVDYGHGPPVHVAPIQGSSIIPVGIVGSLPRPNKGIRLLTWCVEKAHQEPFLQHMSTLI